MESGFFLPEQPNQAGIDMLIMINVIAKLYGGMPPARIPFAGFDIQVVKTGGRNGGRQKNQRSHHRISAEGMQTRAHHDPDGRTWRLIIEEPSTVLFFWLVTFLNILHILLIGACKILFIGFISDAFDSGFLQAFTNRYVGFGLLVPIYDAGLSGNIA